MSLLELKQGVMRLTQSERRELRAFMVRLRHETPAGKREMARRIKAMQAGRYVTIEELEKRLARG